MKNIFFLSICLFAFATSPAQVNPAVTVPTTNKSSVPEVPSATGNKNTYDANSNSHYNSERDIRNVKVQPTNAGNNTDIPTNTATQSAGTAGSPGSGSNRSAGNISSGNTPVSDPTMTNSTIPDNRNNSPRP